MTPGLLTAERQFDGDGRRHAMILWGSRCGVATRAPQRDEDREARARNTRCDRWRAKQARLSKPEPRMAHHIATVMFCIFLLCPAARGSSANFRARAAPLPHRHEAETLQDVHLWSAPPPETEAEPKRSARSKNAAECASMLGRTPCLSQAC